MFRKIAILLLLVCTCTGCMQPDAFAALPLAGNQVYETHGYSFGSKSTVIPRLPTR